MSLRAALGILALVPAALNVSPVAAHGIAVPLCSGGGLLRTVMLPAAGGSSGQDIPGKAQPGCCAKGCHTGCRKKAPQRQIDNGQ